MSDTLDRRMGILHAGVRPSPETSSIFDNYLNRIMSDGPLNVNIWWAECRSSWHLDSYYFLFFTSNAFFSPNNIFTRTDRIEVEKGKMWTVAFWKNAWGNKWLASPWWFCRLYIIKACGESMEGGGIITVTQITCILLCYFLPWWRKCFQVALWVSCELWVSDAAMGHVGRRL